MPQHRINTILAFHKKPLLDAEFLIIDLEMTGLNPFEDDIVEIAAVPMTGTTVGTGDIFYTEVQPQKSISAAAKAIHGLHGKQLTQAPRIEDVMPEVVKLFARRIVVAHSVLGDIQFLRAKSKISGVELPYTPLIDTAKIAKFFFPTRKKLNLDELLAEFEIKSRRDFHNALSDALLTADVFSKMLYRIKLQGKAMFVGDILRIGGV
jgi:DNA polymerase III epsilon subunit family exonuclease